jgi:spermidine dehydrogenase
MTDNITRRDFLGSTLLGSGAALLTAASPTLLAEPSRGAASIAGLGPDWSGPGGIGDYAGANGYVAPMINAGHALRTGDALRGVQDTRETYDVVIVGGGFAGLAAAYTIHKERPDLSCLMLDNAPIFGGHAKQNEFIVDGQRLWAPQGSHASVGPVSAAREAGYLPHFWGDLGLPDDMKYASLTGTQKPLRVPQDIYMPMQWRFDDADCGFFFNDPGVGKDGWVINPWSNGLKGTPWSSDLKLDLLALQQYTMPPRREDWEKWLDSITYLDFLTKTMGLSPKVADYLTPLIATNGCGLGPDAVSALGATKYLEPGVSAYFRDHGNVTEKFDMEVFPGGNTAIARHFVKALIPDAFAGGTSLSDILFSPVNWQAFDRSGQRVRMRFSSTVAEVRHDGSPDVAKGVSVVYRVGQTQTLRQVKARGVVMACGQWINKYVVKDLPQEYREAMDTFHHAPILSVNVAVRNWKFLDRMGITAARWFEGFGWFTTVRRPMLIDERAPMPLDPAKPTVLTMYIPFPVPGLPARQQVAAANGKLLGLSFADIENGVRSQFNKMFSHAGFDASRDIAGIVANRWGHAWIVITPGYYYGSNGKPPPREVIQKGFGRVAFGHSDLSGDQGWDTACAEGERAAKQVIAKL